MDPATADERAVAFIKRFRAPIRYAINLEGVPQHQREDLFQEASVRILQLFRSGRINEAEPGCLSLVITTVRNLCRNHYKSDRRHRGHSEFEDRHAMDPGVDQAERIDRLQAHERLHACVELLPPLQRAVMRQVLKGWSHADIAEEQGIEVNHVKQLAHRARVRLRQLLTNPTLN